MKTKHTPGKLIIKDSYPGKSIVSDDGTLVAYVYHGGGKGTTLPNAVLFKSAPNMLKTLQGIDRLIGKHINKDMSVKTIGLLNIISKLAEKSIAEATGTE